MRTVSMQKSLRWAQASLQPCSNLTGVCQELDGSLTATWQQIDRNMTAIWQQSDSKLTGKWQQFNSCRRHSSSVHQYAWALKQIVSSNIHCARYMTYNQTKCINTSKWCAQHWVWCCRAVPEALAAQLATQCHFLALHTWELPVPDQTLPSWLFLQQRPSRKY